MYWYKQNIRSFVFYPLAKFMLGDTEHADQEFAKVDFRAEIMEECLDISNYAIGLYRYTNYPWLVRFMWSWKLRVMARLTYILAKGLRR